MDEVVVGNTCGTSLDLVIERNYKSKEEESLLEGEKDRGPGCLQRGGPVTKRKEDRRASARLYDVGTPSKGSRKEGLGCIGTGSAGKKD